MKVYNHDIANLVRRMRRFREELIKSVSSGTSEYSEHDLARLNSYLEAIRRFKNWMMTQPVLDLPETSPQELELEEFSLDQNVENDDVAMLKKLFALSEEELVNSQSARRSTSLISHDSIRFDSYVQKMQDFVDNFIVPVSPLDLPESSPSTVMTGQGRKGV